MLHAPRRFLVVTATLFMSWLPTANPDPVTIEVGWLAAPELSVEWIERETLAFQAAHPDIIVHLRDIDTPSRNRFDKHADVFGDHIERVLGANVTGIDSQFGYLTPYLAEHGLIKPIESFDTADDDFALSDFSPALLELARHKGRTWAVPWLARDFVLVMDWELFRQAGIYNPPRTWQEFIDYAAQLTRDTNGDGTIDQYGVAYRTTDDALPLIFMSLIIQQGGRLMRDGRFELDPVSIEQSVQFMHNLGNTWKVAREDGRSLEGRMQDQSIRYAMHLETNQSVGAAIERPELRLAPMPSIDGRPRTLGAYRLYLAVRDSTPKQEAASWEFIKWISRPGVSLPQAIAGFPVRRDFTNRDDFRARMQGKIQNPEVLFTASEYGVLTLDNVVDLAPAMERFWQIMVPSFSNPETTALAIERAEDTANSYLGDWYPR